MYVLLGSNGNITAKAAALLLAKGASVRVIGRSEVSLASLRDLGAQVAAGDIADAGFLARAFDGATAVYAMIPSDYAAADLGASQDRLGAAIAQALQAVSIAHVVSLSSIGAHLPQGTGPITGLYRQEQRLNALRDADVLHLRPGYFYENLLAATAMIPAIGAFTDMTGPDAALPMTATADIAQIVARELLTPSGSGHRILHLHSRSLYTMREATRLLGMVIDRPDLAYVHADHAQGKAALMQQGFSASAAALMAEMSDAFSTGRLDGEYEQGPTEITPTTLETFAKTVFKAVYVQSKSRMSA